MSPWEIIYKPHTQRRGVRARFWGTMGPPSFDSIHFYWHTDRPTSSHNHSTAAQHTNQHTNTHKTGRFPYQIARFLSHRGGSRVEVFHNRDRWGVERVEHEGLATCSVLVPGEWEDGSPQLSYIVRTSYIRLAIPSLASLPDACPCPDLSLSEFVRICPCPSLSDTPLRVRRPAGQHNA